MRTFLLSLLVITALSMTHTATPTNTSLILYDCGGGVLVTKPADCMG